MRPVSATRSTLTPTFTYDRRIGRYRDVQSGRLVAGSTVRRELDRVLDRTQRDARAITQQLRERTITLEAWQREMALLIRRSHAASSSLAQGGWANMTPADWGRVGGNVRRELRYLDRFAQQIADGVTRLDGRVLTRAEMYVQTARIQYERDRAAEAAALGYTRERSILHARDSCDGCIREAARGWVMLGELVPPGQRDCISRCQCTVEYD